MDEAAARAIAEALACPLLAGPTQPPGVHKIDKDSTLRFLEAQWEAGKLSGWKYSLEELRKAAGRKACRPRWIVTYQEFDLALGQKTVTVTIDDETGAATSDVEIHPHRPR